MSNDSFSQKLHSALYNNLFLVNPKCFTVSSTSTFSAGSRNLSSVEASELSDNSQTYLHACLKQQLKAVTMSAISPKFVRRKLKKPQQLKQGRATAGLQIRSETSSGSGTKTETDGSAILEDSNTHMTSSEAHVMGEISQLSYYPKIMFDCWRQKRKQCREQVALMNSNKEQMDMLKHRLQYTKMALESLRTYSNALRNEKLKLFNVYRTQRNDLQYEKENFHNLSKMLEEFELKHSKAVEEGKSVADLCERGQEALKAYNEYLRKAEAEFEEFQKRERKLTLENSQKVEELQKLKQQRLEMDCELAKLPELSVTLALKKDLELELASLQVKQIELRGLLAMNPRDKGALVRQQLLAVKRAILDVGDGDCRTQLKKSDANEIWGFFGGFGFAILSALRCFVEFFYIMFCTEPEIYVGA